MKKILIISDGRPGHYNQSLAVADAIAKLIPSETAYTEIKIKKIGKYLLRALLNADIGKRFFQSSRSGHLISLFYEGYDRRFSPDIIVSAGKDTSLANALLGLQPGRTNIFIGNPKKLDHHLFTAVLSVLDLGFENQIILDVAPTRIYGGDVRNFAQELNLDPQGSYRTLLIGGEGSGYHYNRRDIERLIEFVNTTAAKGVKWLITTSRRTPIEFETLMQDRMNAECFIAFHANPQKVVGGFLRLSESVFVTEDSASMISEAIANQKPVYVLQPEEAAADRNYEAILEKFTASHHVRRIRTAELSVETVERSEKFILLDKTSIDELALKLHPVLEKN